MVKKIEGKTDCYVTEYDLLYETDAALKVELIRQDWTGWLPRSQVEVYEKHMQDWISIPHWLCEEKGIDYA